MRLVVPTAVEMGRLGVRLGRLLQAGDLVLLTGDLGAGKTTLTKGIAAGLGTPGPVTSPTFVIARLHRGGRLPLLHVDAYRLADGAEIDDLDIDAEVVQCVTVVEWGEARAERLAQDRLQLCIERGPAEADETRTVTVATVGDRWTGGALDALADG